VFDPLLRREGPGRAARRAGWIAASAVFHVALFAVVRSVKILVVPAVEEMPVEVKFVKGQPMPDRRAAPPPPPQRRPSQPERRRAAPPPVAPLVQPKALSDEPPRPGPPDPAPPPEASGDEEEGAVGGIPGGSTAAAPAPAGPVPFDEATMSHPVFLSGPSPAYTRRALDRNVEGRMRVECVVTAEGLVRQCRVVEGLPFMDEAVVEALERRRYRPAVRNGQPIAIRYTFRITLKLPD
jgi:protein TonB